MREALKEYYLHEDKVYAVLGLCHLFQDAYRVPGVVYLREGEIFVRSRVEFEREFQACDMEGNIPRDGRGLGRGSRDDPAWGDPANI